MQQAKDDRWPCKIPITLSTATEAVDADVEALLGQAAHIMNNADAYLPATLTEAALV